MSEAALLAAVARGTEHQDPGLTAVEIAAKSLPHRSLRWTQLRLRAMVAEGTMLQGWRHDTNVTGNRIRVPVYSLRG